MSKKFRAEQKSNMKNSVNRLMFAGLSLAIQVWWILELVRRVNIYYSEISIFTTLLALLLTLWLLGRRTNAAIKMSWIVVLLSFPIFGVCLYLLFGRPGATRRMFGKFLSVDETLKPYMKQEEQDFRGLEEKNLGIANQCRYLLHTGNYPVYTNTDANYYADTTEAFEAQLAAIASAKEFIFMEYHAIEVAEAFGRMLELLIEKAKQGVEIRIIYDDVGSIGFLHPSFVKEMERYGIACRDFNPVMPVINLFMNNRDHRKIMVVDGRIGFTGGYNLADEYFNIIHPYGVWKDAGVKLEGNAVQSLTVMFLEMWNSINRTDLDYAPYMKKHAYCAKSVGYVQPYASNPLSPERIGENVYLNLIKYAKKYVYIMTPYLIITDEMSRELTLAAKRGVDVRIVVPGIPDKKVIYQVTCSYFGELASQGVRIFTYTPGFCHAKLVICDDEVATVGTINFDYRSLYHHFENGCLMYDKPLAASVKEDFIRVFPVCAEVTGKYANERTKILRTRDCILRFLAPLL